MASKFIILKKAGLDSDPFLEAVSAREYGAGSEGSSFEFPYEVEETELEVAEADDARRDPRVEDVIESIPFTLIEPLGGDDDSGMAWGVEDVGASTSSCTGAGVVVAILDTGIDRDHAAFRHVRFADDDLMDFTVDEQGRVGKAPDLHGHGTHCAGTLFGSEVEGIRIGIAPGVERVVVGKVLGPKGAPTEAVFNAMQWALRRRADIISMSLGIDFPAVVEALVQRESYPTKIASSRALEAYRSNIRLFDRLARLIEAQAERGSGAIVVAASGNESRRQVDRRFTVAVAPPAAADGFVSVGAVGKTGNQNVPYEVAPFSNTGCLLAAPGVGILSAKLGGGVRLDSGTSMATPHVAGVAALWAEKAFNELGRQPGWAHEVRLSLESKTRKFDGLARNDVGRGIVTAPE